MLALKDQRKVSKQSADLVQILKDVQMKRIYEHAISLSPTSEFSLKQA
jgi:hypothetical protein